jgi:hypothetical protein
VIDLDLRMFFYSLDHSPKLRESLTDLTTQSQ